MKLTSASNGSGTSGGRKPASSLDGAGEHGVASPTANSGEGAEIPLRPEQVLDLGPGVGLGPHASGRRLEPHLPAADDAIQGAVVPEVRPVRAERAKALGRELEAVRVG